MQIRAVSQNVFETAASWAMDEGWNPGYGDLDAFYAADRSGFLMGFLDDTPVCSISVVRYGATYGFLGFYIVHPDHRGTGVGMTIWHAGMAYLEGRVVGLDGVVAQQDNYRKSGFGYDSRNIRFSGIPRVPLPASTDFQVLLASEDHIDALVTYDRQVFPADRRAFLKHWTLHQDGVDRHTKLAVRDGLIIGFATIRKCVSGYKIGPLFADKAHVASTLVSHLIAEFSAYDSVMIDVPEQNVAAIKMAEALGLSPAFETARM